MNKAKIGGMKYDVFISYSRKDYVDERMNVIPGNVVSQVKEALIAAGITFWFDEECIYHGQNFVNKITENIEESRIFLFLSSKNSNQSIWTSREIGIADERKKHIIPFRIDESRYNREVEIRIVNLDYIVYYTNPEKGMAEMVESIKKYLEQVREEEEKKRREAEETRRQKEEEEQHRIEEQKRIFNDIKFDCNKLNIEETKLLTERDNLLLRTDNVLDTEKRTALKKEIQNSSPICQKLQEERLGLVKEMEDLKNLIQIKNKESEAKSEKLQQKDKQIAQLEKDLKDVSNNKTSSEPAIRTVNKPAITRFHVLYILSFLAVALISLFWIVKDEKELAPYRQAKLRGEFTVNGVFFKMIPVEGGKFQMGSETGDNDERPVHEVTVDGFYISETEVTQELWEAVMGTNPSCFKGSKLPVEKVSWNDCQIFITKLNQLTGKKFRLPTEAEWEFAARGGIQSKGYTYSGSNIIDDVAWYTSNSNGTTHEVGTKAPNELGLYDMSGNVWEWCQDWYASDSYSTSVVNNLAGSSSDSIRVRRGGSWYGSATLCRVADRSYNKPLIVYYNLGFRLAL